MCLQFSFLHLRISTGIFSIFLFTTTTILFWYIYSCRSLLRSFLTIHHGGHSILGKPKAHFNYKGWPPLFLTGEHTVNIRYKHRYIMWTIQVFHPISLWGLATFTIKSLSTLGKWCWQRHQCCPSWDLIGSSYWRLKLVDKEWELFSLKFRRMGKCIPLIFPVIHSHRVNELQYYRVGHYPRIMGSLLSHKLRAQCDNQYRCKESSYRSQDLVGSRPGGGWRKVHGSRARSLSICWQPGVKTLMPVHCPVVKMELFHQLSLLPWQWQ